MPKDELKTQINEGVEFWNYEENKEILGVMGIQFMNEVTLIRHAYIRTSSRQKGIGGIIISLIGVEVFVAIVNSNHDSIRKELKKQLDIIEKNK